MGGTSNSKDNLQRGHGIKSPIFSLYDNPDTYETCIGEIASLFHGCGFDVLAFTS
jgi:hypothetical protein